MKKTPLHQEHTDLKAKMAEFAGYDMPIQYSDGVMAEHKWTRSSCGLFDVSHMGQIYLEGQNVVKFLERLTPSSIGKLGIGRTKYTVLTNEQGGIIDDLMITRCNENGFFCIINAACKEKDIAWIKSHLPANVKLEHFEDHALLALQGPKAESVLESLGYKVSSMRYMDMKVFDEETVYISRLGYTGEDGFEISLPAGDAAAFWRKLLDHEAVKPIGLAARDSLRLEMGYCLYGHDIDDQTSPVEADLAWIMGKKENKSFFGAKRVFKDLENVSKKRVGIALIDRGVAREGMEIFSINGQKIGSMTSGGFSPTLEASIGQGYVSIDFAEHDTDIIVQVRGRPLKAKITPMPFVEPKTKISVKKNAA